MKPAALLRSCSKLTQMGLRNRTTATATMTSGVAAAATTAASLSAMESFTAPSYRLGRARSGQSAVANAAASCRSVSQTTSRSASSVRRFEMATTSAWMRCGVAPERAGDSQFALYCHGALKAAVAVTLLRDVAADRVASELLVAWESRS